MRLGEQFETLLASSRGERKICAWLKKNPKIFCGILPFVNYIAAEFPFGSDFRADFVGLGPFSGGWDVHFVELESPDAPLFTQKGTPARRLVEAMSQAAAWRVFVEKHRDCVLRELSKFVQQRELLWGKRDHEPVDHAGWELYHPRSSLIWQYHIVIGRLGNLTDADIERKSGFRSHISDLSVMTYDRILRQAQQIDSRPPMLEA